MIENTILSNLVFNEDYCRKVIPFIKDEYFTGAGNKIVFSIISDYVDKYDALPTAAVSYTHLTLPTTSRV